MSEFIKKMYRNQAVRYIFFGGCTTFVNLGSYAFLRMVCGVDMTLANVIAIFLSILFAYVVNKQFVFESKTTGARQLLTEMGSFIGMRLSTMFIEVFGVVFLSCLFAIPEVISKLALQVVVLVLNYIFSKVFVFSKKEKEPLNPVKRNCCILGFAIPAVTIALAFAVNQVFPFGDHGVLIIDSLHQYLPFFTEFHEKLEQGSSLRYSFGGGLGFNFWATYAYYLASPLNFLIVLFPKRNVMDAMAFLIVLKIGLCGLTSAWYFSTKSKGKTYMPLVFSLMFSLSSFIIGYYFNVMWLDSIAMLPLVMMGIERIVRGGRGNLFCISLFYGLYCNYYIGFMLCLFSCLYFVVLWISAKRFQIKKLFISAVNFGWHALLAGGMASVVLVPAYIALGITESAENSFPSPVKLFVNNLSQLTSQFAFCEPINIADDQIGVNAFCGTVTLILAVLYLLDKNIKLRERIAKTALLVLLYASFDVNVLNYIWHGFHVQNGLPNRFAFIYIFLMLTMAFDAWRHMERFSVRQILLSVAVPLAFVIYATVTGLGEREMYTYGLTIAILAVDGIWMLIYRSGRTRKEIFRSVFFFLAAAEMFSYAIFGVFFNGTVGRSTYLDEQIAYEETTARQEGKAGNQDNFYRSEIDSSRMRDENMFLGADGVVLFSSTMPAATVDMCKGLGIEARTNKNGYNGFTKLINDIFGVKYVLSSRGTDRLYQMDKVDQEGDMNLFKNSGALSLGFMVGDDIIDWSTEGTDHFGVQNEFVNLATGMDNIFEWKETIDMEDGGTYTIVLPAGKQVYLDVTTAVDSIEISTPEYTRTYDIYNDHLYDLGCFDAIDNATVTCTFKENQSGPVTAEVWVCDQEAYQKVHDKLAKSQLQLTHFEDGAFSGTVDVKEDGVLMLSLPYDEGWSLKIDGEEDDYYMIGDALTGIDLTEGTHTIEMTYTPEGLWMGTLLSLICVALYLLTTAIGQRIEKNRPQEPDEEESDLEEETEEVLEENPEETDDTEADSEDFTETDETREADFTEKDADGQEEYRQEEGDGEDHGI